MGKLLTSPITLCNQPISPANSKVSLICFSKIYLIAYYLFSTGLYKCFLWSSATYQPLNNESNFLYTGGTAGNGDRALGLTQMDFSLKSILSKNFLVGRALSHNPVYFTQDKFETWWCFVQAHPVNRWQTECLQLVS